METPLLRRTALGEPVAPLQKSGDLAPLPTAPPPSASLPAPASVSGVGRDRPGEAEPCLRCPKGHVSFNSGTLNESENQSVREAKSRAGSASRLPAAGRKPHAARGPCVPPPPRPTLGEAAALACRRPFANCCNKAERGIEGEVRVTSEFAMSSQRVLRPLSFSAG